MIDKINIAESVKTIRATLTEADEAFWRSLQVARDTFNEYDAVAKYYVDKAFIQVLVLLEVQGLSHTYEVLSKIYHKAQKEGFLKSAMGIHDPYLIWSEVLDTYLDAIGNSFNVDSSMTIVSKDLISILRETAYSITDSNLFASSPSSEIEVHQRIEGVLRCVFPDLKHKPQLTKQIKNFEPDTGLPSIDTLIEYKFISNQKQAKLVVDQLLTDTRGYTSREWKTFLYVIYETHRVYSEKQWNQLLAECEADKHTRVIVISGEPSKSRSVAKKGPQKKQKR